MHIGIDLGGTKTEILAFSGAGEVLYRRRVATVRDYAGSLDQLRSLVLQLEAETGRPGTVGIGIPGSISPLDGLVRNANSTWLNGRPLVRDLQACLGRTVRAENDANCFVLSEATDGAAAGAPSVFGVILGTGVGGGLVIHGRLITGAQGIAGEWGHNPLPGESADDGASCWCGRRGCVETWLSGSGLARDYLGRTGRSLSAADVAAAADRGEADAAACIDAYVARLGRSLAGVVNLLDPDVIVLGGGLSNITELAPRAAEALLPHVFCDRPLVPVRRHAHGDSSGVRGAAWLGAQAAGSPEPRNP
jgi:predicted NBD/HSP70 family sugar kinase